MPTILPILPAAPVAHDAPTVSHKGTLDLMGASASIVCAAHCAVVALALGLMPVLGFMANPWIDIAFLIATLAIGVASLVPSWLHHNQRRPLVFFGVGVAILVFARLLGNRPGLEFVLVLVGATYVVSAHWQNRRLLKACAHQHV
jgi:hypothetical protein